MLLDRYKSQSGTNVENRKNRWTGDIRQSLYKMAI